MFFTFFTLPVLPVFPANQICLRKIQFFAGKAVRSGRKTSSRFMVATKYTKSHE